MKRALKIIIVLVVLAALVFAYFKTEHLFYKPKLERETLDISLEKGRQFLLNNQKEEGNFTYEYDFINKEYKAGDSQVRQAGAMWGTSLIHQDNPSAETLEAVKRALAFFKSYSTPIEGKGQLIAYPNEGCGEAGTVALVALSCIEMLRTDLDSANKALFKNALDDYLLFLLSLRNEDGRISQSYNNITGEAIAPPSPYFDGETLLALTKAAKYLGHDDLKPLILESAEAMYQAYVIEAQKKEKDSDLTKGFYQWGSMSFFEIYTAGWDDKYAQRVIDLAYWMIDTHRTLWRRKNTAYAHEGIISAYQIAKLTENEKAQKKFIHAIDKALRKLTSWQVGGPTPNRYIRKHPTEDKNAVGGIMNCKKCPVLRIDVTQHQMHAVILARRYVYTE